MNNKLRWGRYVFEEVLRLWSDEGPFFPEPEPTLYSTVWNDEGF